MGDARGEHPTLRVRGRSHRSRSVTVAPVFDEAFFAKELAERVEQFSGEHEGLGVRVEVVTVEGEHLDLLEIAAADRGLRLVTRDDRLVFVPYANIAHLDVSLLRDHRITSFDLASMSA